MSANNTHLSMKDKIMSHLPGHKNQDKNMNGVPDRLEKNTAATAGRPTLSDKNGNGIPDRLERNQGFAQGSALPLNQDLNRNGVPDALERQGSYGLNSGSALPLSQDLNRNGIPDSFERQGSYGLNQGSALPLSQDLNRNGIPDALERQGSGFTDLNRNGIPDQLEGQGFGFVGSTTVNTQSFVDVREAPVIVEKIEKPAVVHEVYKTEEVVQIQPIIEREREKLDVYEVVQPMREREVIATEVRQAVLPAQTRATIVEDNSAFLAQRSAPTDFSTREVAATMTQTVQNAPIVHETIVHKVIEEVQPVIYKEIDRPILVKETLPIYEKIVEAPHAHHSVLPMRDLGVRSVTTGFTDLNRDGIPDQLQGGMAYQTTGLNSGLQSQGSFMPGQGLTAGDKIASHLPGHQFQDRNGNGIPDKMEGRNMDLNRDGIPDRLQGGQFQSQGRVAPRTLSDLNGNGIPDRMEKAHGLKDLNGNGVDDSLERRMRNSNLNSQTF